MNWIKLKVFSEMSGYTPKAVYNKVARGQWVLDIHYRKAPDGRYFINPKAVEDWARGL